MTLVSSSLSPKNTARITDMLILERIPFETSQDGIMVHDQNLSVVQLLLAEEGFLREDPIGNELLDQLSGFSTTSKMFEATYWRAKEGELSQTIQASPFIKSARVHIGVGRGQGLLDKGSLSAAVSLVQSSDAPPQNFFLGIRSIVASAVPNLAVESVQVFNAETGELFSHSADTSSGRVLEKEQHIRENLERIITQWYPGDDYTVAVNVEVENATIRLENRNFLPERQFERSRSEQVQSKSINRSSDSVTVASNLNQPANEPEGDEDGVLSSSRNVVSNFEAPEELLLKEVPPGAIKRIDVAILIRSSGYAQSIGDREGDLPDDPTELEEALAVAAGIDVARGDMIDVTILPALPEIQGPLLLVDPFASRSSPNNSLSIPFSAILVGCTLIIALIFFLYLKQSKSRSRTTSLDTVGEGMLEKQFTRDSNDSSAPKLPPGIADNQLEPDNRRVDENLLALTSSEALSTANGAITAGNGRNMLPELVEVFDTDHSSAFFLVSNWLMQPRRGETINE